MKKNILISWILIGITVFILIGCGGSYNLKDKETAQNSSYATAMLGNLAQANVEIYQIENNGSLTLKWRETTSNGDRLDDIGKFNAHFDELDEERYYLYKVIGGKDWDANDDGIKDDIFTQNKGVIRAIAKGNTIKSVGSNFKVTYASELLYEKIVYYLKYKFNSRFDEIVQENVKKIIEDINEDGLATIEDILQFNPVKDKNKLSSLYKGREKQIVSLIHQGKIPALELNKKLANFFSGNMFDIALSPNEKIAYVTDFRKGVFILDISNSNRVTYINTLEITDFPLSIALSADGTKAYVTYSLNKKLVIWDISDPYNPSKLGSCAINGVGWDIVLSSDGKFAYIAMDEDGIAIVDISNSNNPLLKSVFDTSGKAYSLALSLDNTKLFVANYSKGLDIIDISNASNPQEITTYISGSKTTSVALSPDGKKAFVSDKDNGLIILDVSDIEHIRLLSQNNFLHEGERLIVSKDGSKVYAASYGVVVIDVSDSFHPFIEQTFMVGNSGLNLAISKNETRAFIINKTLGLTVFDISKTKEEVGSFNPNFYIYDTKLSWNEKLAYLAADEKGLLILDIKNIQNPSLVGYYNGVGKYIDIALLQDLKKAYVASWQEKVFIFDLLNPNRPLLRGSYDSGTKTRKVLFAHNRKLAFVADNDNGLIILDTTNFYNPVLLSSIDMPGGAKDVAISADEKIIFVLGGDGKLRIYGINQANNPTLIGLLDSDEINGDKIVISKDSEKAYILSQNKGLALVNISNPSHSLLLGTYKEENIMVFYWDIALSNDEKEVYLATNNGLTVVDVSNPTNPIKSKVYGRNSFFISVTLSPDMTKAFVSNYFSKRWSIYDLKLYE